MHHKLISYKDTLNYLYEQLPMFHRIGAAAYKADLNNTHAIMQLLRHPEHNFRSVHIAGTNGKGSTSHMLASVLQEAGYKTGLYTSPHLKDFRERIRINGKMISKKFVIDFVNEHKGDFEKIKPSFFEWTVGLAFDYFSNAKVDIAIIETGLGGRLDSTNVINPLVSVITNISFDHTNLLGNTLRKIASEKAGIIKNNIPVIIGSKQKEVESVFIKTSKQLKAPLTYSTDKFQISKSNQVLRKDKLYFEGIINSKDKLFSGRKIYCDLPGLYQQKNIPSVLCAAEVLRTKHHFNISDKAIFKGIENTSHNTGLKGRWHVLNLKPLTICDIAHNEDGMLQIINQIKKLRFNHLHFVLGMVSDKDISKVLSLLPANATYYFCRADIPRAMDANELQQKAMEKGLTGKVYTSVKRAMQAAQRQASNHDLIFIGGSTFTVAELKLT